MQNFVLYQACILALPVLVTPSSLRSPSTRGQGGFSAFPLFPGGLQHAVQAGRGHLEIHGAPNMTERDETPERDETLGASEMGQFTDAFSSHRFCQACGALRRWNQLWFISSDSFWLLSGEMWRLFYGLLSFENQQPWNVSVFTWLWVLAGGTQAPKNSELSALGNNPLCKKSWEDFRPQNSEWWGLKHKVIFWYSWAGFGIFCKEIEAMVPQ